MFKYLNVYAALNYVNIIQHIVVMFVLPWYVLEHKRVVRIDNDEHRSTRERVQIARIQTVRLFVGAALASIHQSTVHTIPLNAGRQSTQFIAI